jgi:predicted nucleotidyltransferase
MVNIYKQELTNLQYEILILLSVRAGTSLNQNGISRELGVSQTAVAKAIPVLEKSDYINVKKDKMSGRWDISLKRENKKVINLKRVLNLKMLYKSQLIDYLEESFPGTTIILFGSYSKGEDTNKSDIDITIVGSAKKELNLVRFNKTLEKTIFLHFFESFSKIPKELKENICNGIVFSGGIEL